MIPLAEKPIDWKLKPRIGKPIKTKGRSFFDVPYGATACNCGNKIVAQGRCQKCWDKFVKGLKAEHTQMKVDKKADENWEKKMWRRV